MLSFIKATKYTKEIIECIKIFLWKSTKKWHFIGLLRQKDIEQALLLEEKMSLQLRLLAAAGLEPPSPPSYRHLVSENADTGQMWKEVLTAVQVINEQYNDRYKVLIFIYLCTVFVEFFLLLLIYFFCI